jgi:excisionase family DNA binding protein
MSRFKAEIVHGMFESMKSPPPPVLTLEQAAALLQLQEDTLRRMVHDGRITKSVKHRYPLRFLRDGLVLEYMCIPKRKSDSASRQGPSDTVREIPPD